MLGASVPSADEAKEKVAPSSDVRRTWSGHPEQPSCAATHQCRSSMAVTDDAPETSPSVMVAGAGLTAEGLLDAVDVSGDALGCEAIADDRSAAVEEAPDTRVEPSADPVHGWTSPMSMPT